MNKKKLSVVMAGAMLASSVAPVLAAEVQKSEHSANELGLLQKELRELVQDNLFANDSKNNPKDKDGNPIGDVRNQSVYKIYVNNNIALGVDEKTPLNEKSTQADWQKVFNDLNAGDVVKVVSKGFKEVDGKLYHYDFKEGAVETYTQSEVEGLDKIFYTSGKLNNQYSKIVEKAGYNSDLKGYVVKFYNDVKIPGSLDEQDTLVLKEGDTKLKFETAVGKNWETLSYYTNEAQTEEAQLYAENPVEIEDFYGFVLSEKVVNNGYSPIKSEVVREITITPGGYNFDISDLYDGLFLTTKGDEFFTMLREAVSADRKVVIVVNDAKDSNKAVKYTVNKRMLQNEEQLKDIEAKIFSSLKEYNKGYKVEVKLGATDKLAEEVYTVTGKNKSEMARVTAWMAAARPRVKAFDGANRYETAVEIAKEYAGLTGDITSKRNKADIVLVNGDALVDGLAAAPLAASLEDTKNGLKTPVLLTEADELPRATKAYLKEVIKNVQVGKLGKVTVHLVGGKTVLNKSLESELRDLGFTVERYSGENREETSLEVAKAIDKKFGEAFVVGGEGEADAMSIASVAAATKTPIIVAKKGGISEDATYALRGKVATVIGGKKVVTDEEYNEIKAEAKGVQRVYGENRHETNAEIISKFYKKAYVGEAKNVIIAADGLKGTSLVDALAAANMAAAKNAPIVLATDKVSKAQENALELNAKKSFALYQVGGKVSRDAVKTVAYKLGLTDLR